MTLIDVRCLAPDCGHLFPTMRPIADWPAVPPCEKCHSPATEQAHLPPHARRYIDPIVVFQAPDGSFRFPGDLSGPMTAQYRQQGYREVTLRSATDVRRFEAHINTGQRETDERRCERREQMQALRESASRSDLRQAMQGMTRRNRDLARAAMEQNDRKPRQRPHDGGFHVEALSYDHSNRMESRGPDGRRRRD